MIVSEPTAPGRPPAELSPLDQRILGALLEKQRTVPASYPLSLNALRTACNQTSSRDPVTDYDDETLEQRLRDLKHRELVKVVWAGKGSRTLKYHQLLTDRLGLADDESALITVLLLRGAQSPGELKTRTERLHAFADREAVEDCLVRLAGRRTPLVRRIDRRAGQHDHRWIHLLGTPGGEPEPAAPAIDREGVLTDGAATRDARVVAAYDAAAAAYAERFGDELAHKPFDRWLLTRVAELAGGPVADVGCGPGQTTRFLADAGAEVTGFDLSPAMIETACATRPDLTFRTGDLTRLLRPPAAAAWGAITGWYALGHLAASELPGAVGSLSRVLARGGWLALAVHAGDEIRHLDELLGQPVDLDLVLHDPDEVLRAIAAAGLEPTERYLRGPLPDVETPTERFYVLARKP